MTRSIVGILGGMGPLAGVSFAEKLIDVAASMKRITCDQDQIPFVLWSIPQIPDRGLAAFDPLAPDPFPMMVEGIKGLVRAGASVIAIACNTAHLWHPQLANITSVPILHIVDIAVSCLRQKATVSRVGILAGAATLKSQLYQARLFESGYCTLIPSDTELDELVMRSIMFVKQARVDDALPLAERAVESLRRRGAEVVILGCTELPIIFERPSFSPSIPTINPTHALAEACAVWCRTADERQGHDGRLRIPSAPDNCLVPNRLDGRRPKALRLAETMQVQRKTMQVQR